MRVARCALLAFAACQSPAAPPASGHASQPLVASDDGWAWVNPLPQGASLNALTVAGNELFAAGDRGVVLRTTDASTWERLPTPTASPLYAAFAFSGSDLWVAGAGGALAHWDGTKWAAHSVTIYSLYALWGAAPNDVWAGADFGALYHWDGTAWSTSAELGSTMLIRSIWGRGANDVFLAGSDRGLFHWDGATWSAEIDREAFGFSEGFRAIVGTPNATRAVSNLGNVWFRNGSSRWDIEARLGDTALHAGVASTGDDVVLVGAAGGSWQSAGGWSPSATGTKSSFNAIAALGAQLVAVGGEGTVARRNGPNWSLPLGPRTHLNAVVSTGAGRATAVGEGGVIAALTATAVSNENSTVTANLRALTVSGTTFTAVGEGGVAVSKTAASWSRDADAGTPEDLLAVWAASGTEVYAVGRRGAAVRKNGATWAALSSGVTTDLYALHGTARTDLWAVGYDGVALHWDGSMFTRTPTPTHDRLTGVFALAANNVLAVGEKQTALKWNGTTWSRLATGRSASVSLRAVWGAAPDLAFAAGDRGELLAFDGATWALLHSGATTDLLGITGSGASDVFAIGKNGTVLHRDAACPANMPCDDADPCTHTDRCSAAGVCRGTAVACTSDLCSRKSCNGTSSCDAQPRLGQPCDDGDPCSRRDVCDPGGTCKGERYPALPGCCTAPQIAKDANTSASVGTPYTGNAMGAFHLANDAVASFDLCGERPAGFELDSDGQVWWVPVTAGTVALCIQAHGPCGDDQYMLTVEVKPPRSASGCNSVPLLLPLACLMLVRRRSRQ